ncbi:RhoGAP domain containing protein [Histomonas meleagridis]|uniref:RhoGAP domain containing protein n=1 Tax=Histomonas meleagridis TaxID=135588 RepID=UPI00355A4A7D|nr:RhoGAP domain containing protein [Histomonas meleagridis]KAH0799944.1 RhoGAP domain containing protein [Histomonas meleagridis]
MQNDKKGYYAYFDQKKQRYYYLDAALGTTTWKYPENAIVLDPHTRKPFPNPNEVSNSKSPVGSATEPSPFESLSPQANPIIQTNLPPQPSQPSQPQPPSQSVKRPHPQLHYIPPSQRNNPRFQQLFQQSTNNSAPSRDQQPVSNEPTPSLSQSLSPQSISPIPLQNQPPTLSSSTNISQQPHSTTVTPSLKPQSFSSSSPPPNANHSQSLYSSSNQSQQPKVLTSNTSTKPSQNQSETNSIPQKQTETELMQTADNANANAVPPPPPPPPISDQEYKNVVIEVDPKIKNFVPPEQCAAPKPPKPPEKTGKRKERLPPVSFTDEIHKFVFRDFAQQHFQKQKERRVFRRTKVSLDNLITFQTKPLTAPLLQSLPEMYKRDAIRCFNLILSYTGANGKSNLSAACELVSILYSKAPLIDEVYFQIMKQTQGNTSQDCLIATYNLFLIIATIFPSTLNSETWIKSFLSQRMNYPDPKISATVKFTYIRFTERCSIGKQLDGMLLQNITEIPLHVYTSRKVFGVSLYEIMWNQRKIDPNCPIPLVLYEMIKKLLELNCESHVGIFRITGSGKEVDQMICRANEGVESFLNDKVDDIASLLKSWVRDLAEPLIPYTLVSKLMKLKDKEYISFVKTLPKLHVVTLGYLVGFLQQMAKNEKVTKMDKKNLAIVFGPNIVQSKEILIYGKQIADLGINFIAYLIDKWDVSQYYPLDLENFVNSEDEEVW